MTPASLDALTAALVSAAPALDERGRVVARAAYQILGRGAPASDDAVASASGLPVAEVRGLLELWPGVFRDDADRTIGFWGLSLSETPHSLDINATRLFAWCAWDTLFLPAVLGADAVVRSSDPQSDAAITLTVAPDAVTRRSHGHLVVSFLAPDDPFTDDIVTSFCHYVHFFTDADAARPWLAAHDGTFVVPLDDAFELGRRWNAARGL